VTVVPASLSYVSGVSQVPLLGDTIGDNFDRTAARHGDRAALVDRPSGRRWSYSQLRADVDSLALGLLAAGIGKGDRVGIWAPNCPEWLLTQYATAKIGAILVTINPAYQSRDLEYVLTAAGIRLLVAAESVNTADYAAMISEVGPRCTDLERVVLIGSPQWAQLPVREGDASLLAATQGELSPDDPTTSSTPRARLASLRAPRCRITTSSTMATSSDSCAVTPKPTGSVCRCRCITVSAW
jgi:fatty-acyl-CoA synthase